ncbi:MAG: hypothetical protein RL095_781 [Verrucomicrobiota bacterium]|jgi:hypothetical protein
MEDDQQGHDGDGQRIVGPGLGEAPVEEMMGAAETAAARTFQAGEIVEETRRNEGVVSGKLTPEKQQAQSPDSKKEGGPEAFAVAAGAEGEGKFIHGLNWEKTG